MGTGGERCQGEHEKLFYLQDVANLKNSPPGETSHPSSQLNADLATLPAEGGLQVSVSVFLHGGKVRLCAMEQVIYFTPEMAAICRKSIACNLHNCTGCSC